MRRQGECRIGRWLDLWFEKNVDTEVRSGECREDVGDAMRLDGRRRAVCRDPRPVERRSGEADTVLVGVTVGDDREGVWKRDHHRGFGAENSVNLAKNSSDIGNL